MNWKNTICQDVGSESFPDIERLVMHFDSDKSSIDVFFSESRRIITSTPLIIENDDWIGVNNTVAFISLTENFFRSVLSNIILLCPMAKKSASDNSINLGSVLWHPSEKAIRGAFENISFSDSKKIVEVTKKFIGVDLNGSPLNSIITQFSHVCEIRHAIVHSGRFLAGKNALLLNVPSNNKLLKVKVGYSELQKIAAICTGLVVSYNKFLFFKLCERWAVEWRRQNFCKVDNEVFLFKQIWRIFYSKINADEGTIPERATWKKCMKEIKREYSI